MENHTHNHKHNVSGKIGLAFFLNLGFAIIEFFGGIFTNSLAITSDALHDFGDAISLGTSWLLEKKAQQKRSDTYSYGYGRFSLLGAIINGTVLIVGSSVIALKAMPRLFHPESVNANEMIVFAILGIIINGIAALKLSGTDSKNAKFVFYHMLEDVLGWVAVFISSIVMLFFKAPFLDVLLSLAIVAYVLYNVIKNLTETIGLFLQKIPENYDLEKLKTKLSNKFSCRVHDLHLWTLDGEENIFSAHVALKKNCTLEKCDQIKSDIKNYLKRIGIAHATIEIEAEDNNCSQTNC